MNFEFDPEKSEKNKEKHGIDFIDAQGLWEDSESIGFPAKSDNEKRYAIIAKLNELIWLALYTKRGGNTRLISVRRARKKEKELCES